jgi:hypothetical protein
MLCQSGSPVPCWWYLPSSSNQELTIKECNFFFIAIQNVIGALWHFASGRIVLSMKEKEESKDSEDQVSMIQGYREDWEWTCQDILDVLDKHLIPSAASGEFKVSYHKMWVAMYSTLLILWCLSIRIGCICWRKVSMQLTLLPLVKIWPLRLWNSPIMQ